VIFGFSAIPRPRDDAIMRDTMREPSNTTLILVRYVLPAVVVVGGIAAVIISPNLTSLEGAAGIVGAGLSIWLLNVLHRLGVSGDRDRDSEQDARAYFDAHGHWPGEPALVRTRHRRHHDHR
jgi:hypothetical protein